MQSASFLQTIDRFKRLSKQCVSEPEFTVRRLHSSISRTKFNSSMRIHTENIILLQKLIKIKTAPMEIPFLGSSPKRSLRKESLAKKREMQSVNRNLVMKIVGAKSVYCLDGEKDTSLTRAANPLKRNSTGLVNPEKPRQSIEGHSLAVLLEQKQLVGNLSIPIKYVRTRTVQAESTIDWQIRKGMQKMGKAERGGLFARTGSRRTKTEARGQAQYLQSHGMLMIGSFRNRK